MNNKIAHITCIHLNPLNSIILGEKFNLVPTSMIPLQQHSLHCFMPSYHLSLFIMHSQIHYTNFVKTLYTCTIHTDMYLICAKTCIYDF